LQPTKQPTNPTFSFFFLLSFPIAPRGIDSLKQQHAIRPWQTCIRRRRPTDCLYRAHSLRARWLTSRAFFPRYLAQARHKACLYDEAMAASLAVEDPQYSQQVLKLQAAIKLGVFF
jgi:hypothetical protein